MHRKKCIQRPSQTILILASAPSIFASEVANEKWPCPQDCDSHRFPAADSSPWLHVSSECPSSAPPCAWTVPSAGLPCWDVSASPPPTLVSSDASAQASPPSQSCPACPWSTCHMPQSCGHKYHYRITTNGYKYHFVIMSKGLSTWG